ALNEFTSRLTSANSVHAWEAASVRSTRSRTLRPQNDAALSARWSCHACSAVAPTEMLPIVSAVEGDTVTRAPEGALSTLTVACTPAALVQPLFLSWSVRSAISRRSRNESPSHPPPTEELATLPRGGPADVPALETT